MEHPGFFDKAAAIPLAALATRVGAELGPGADGARLIDDVKTLVDAAEGELTFFNNRKYLDQLSGTGAGACLLVPNLRERLPAHTTPLLTAAPYRGFALALKYFYPDALRPQTALLAAGAPPVSASAQLEEGVRIEPGAVVGGEARIGSGTIIAAGALVGYRVRIGRGCFIGPGASVTHALVGDNVILHAGVRIGQDGFGFVLDAAGHLKVPQIGRVIIEDDVEIGANSCVDRGALNDTLIGRGTKIDNLVQIGHNVVIGRHCVLVAHVGISGSTELGDLVVMGGQSGAAGHIRIGAGAQVAGGSHVKDDVAPGVRVGGTPAVPLFEWGRQLAALKRLTRKSALPGRDA
jgi:UDP-3-O-[3-hydroxymyristoyl] glucosamine N-acyltransferase